MHYCTRSVNTQTNGFSPANRRNTKRLLLPHCFTYVGWLLCVSLIAGCSYVLVLYGMGFGNNKSLQWLGTVALSILQDALLLDPAKIMMLALFVALFSRKIRREERTQAERQMMTLAADEEWLRHPEGVDSQIRMEPPGAQDVEEERKIRFQEAKMYSISRELVFYVFFIFLVLAIAGENRDPDGYHQNSSVKELLRLKLRDSTVTDENRTFAKVLSYNDVWGWAEELLLPELYPQPWYQNQAYPNKTQEFPGRLYLNDLTSKIVTGVRLRQVRVRKESCDTAQYAKDITSIDCADRIQLDNEETQDFMHTHPSPWLSKSTNNYGDEELKQETKPWRHQTWKELDAYPILAELETYYGGGYVVELFPKWDNMAILRELKEKQWLDHHSRALIIEIALINPVTNLFNSVNIVFELPPSGGIVHYSSVLTVKLHRRTAGYEVFSVVCEVLYLICLGIFAIREARLMYKQGVRQYLKLFWNKVEVCIVLLSTAGVALCIYRDLLVRALIKRIPSKQPDIFINFQFAANIGLIYTYILAIIVFFVMLKFSKLLRFNKRIGMLSQTLQRAWNPIKMLAVTFFIYIIGLTFMGTIVFGYELHGYRNVAVTVTSILRLLLGKFSYRRQFQNTNRVLGPIFFLFFNVMINWILMNMFIAILNDAFAEVQRETRAQQNDYELIDFILGRVKDWFGFNSERHSLPRNYKRSLDCGDGISRSVTPAGIDDSVDDEIFGLKHSTFYKETPTGFKESTTGYELSGSPMAGQEDDFLNSSSTSVDSNYSGHTYASVSKNKHVRRKVIGGDTGDGSANDEELSGVIGCETFNGEEEPARFRDCSDWEVFDEESPVCLYASDWELSEDDEPPRFFPKWQTATEYMDDYMLPFEAAAGPSGTSRCESRFPPSRNYSQRNRDSPWERRAQEVDRQAREKGRRRRDEYVFGLKHSSFFKETVTGFAECPAGSDVGDEDNQILIPEQVDFVLSRFEDVIEDVYLNNRDQDALDNLDAFEFALEQDALRSHSP